MLRLSSVKRKSQTKSVEPTYDEAQSQRQREQVAKAAARIIEGQDDTVTEKTAERALELRSKGMVVLREGLPKFWLRQASKRAGIALQETTASDDGYYDVELAPQEGGMNEMQNRDMEHMATRIWEPVIGACRPEATFERGVGTGGMWCFHMHGLLATTPSAESPWPKRPASVTAAEVAAGLLVQARASTRSDVLRPLECIHVIVPLAAIKGQKGALGAAALDLSAGQILVIDDTTPHLAFGRSTKKSSTPLLYWTYIHRSCASLAWGDGAFEAKLKTPLTKKQKEMAERVEAQSLIIGTNLQLKVPSRCRKTLSKLQDHSEARRVSLLERYADLRNEEMMQIQDVTVDEEPKRRNTQENARTVELRRSQSWLRTMTRSSLQSLQQSVPVLFKSMSKKFGQSLKQKTSSNNKVSLFQGVTTSATPTTPTTTPSDNSTR